MIAEHPEHPEHPEHSEQSEQSTRQLIESFIRLGEETARNNDELEYEAFIRPVYELTYHLRWTKNFDPNDLDFDETVRKQCYNWFSVYFNGITSVIEFVEDVGDVPIVSSRELRFCMPMVFSKRYVNEHRLPDETIEQAIDRIFSDDDFVDSFWYEFQCAVEEDCPEMHGRLSGDESFQEYMDEMYPNQEPTIQLIHQLVYNDGYPEDHEFEEKDIIFAEDFEDNIEDEFMLTLGG